MKLSDTPKARKHGDADKVKYVKKKRLQDDKKQSATVRELLKQKRTDLDMSIPIELKSPEHIDKGYLICFFFLYNFCGCNGFVFQKNAKKLKNRYHL